MPSFGELLGGLNSGFVAIIHDPRLLATVLVLIALVITIASLVAPFFDNSNLDKRMKAVASERARLRQRDRDAMARGENVSLRQAPQPLLKQLVDSLDLDRWFGTETAKELLIQAGYRSPGAINGFLVARFVMPLILAALAVLLCVTLLATVSLIVKTFVVLLALYGGIKLPELLLRNEIQKRRTSIRRAWPDAIDLMLICVESGMSVEVAFRKVSGEVSGASVPLAEELLLTTAELSYLPERRKAYENLAQRTGIEAVKSVVSALAQAEKYGTSVGSSLRVLAQESRDMRMMEAERKAAALPPKLTVPMVVCFLPVLFIVILGPAAIQSFGLN